MEHASEKVYSSRDIQNYAGITKMQLNHWINVGAIIPYKDNRGRGKVRKFSRQNLIEALICRELSKLYISSHVMEDLLFGLRVSGFSDVDKEECTFWEMIEVSDIPQHLAIFSLDDGFIAVDTNTRFLPRILREESPVLVINFRSLYKQAAAAF